MSENTPEYKRENYDEAKKIEIDKARILSETMNDKNSEPFYRDIKIPHAAAGVVEANEKTVQLYKQAEKEAYEGEHQRLLDKVIQAETDLRNFEEQQSHQLRGGGSLDDDKY